MPVTNVYAAKPAHIQRCGQKIGGVLRAAIGQGILTDAIVGGASYDTVTKVKTAIDLLVKPINRPWAVKVKNALDKGVSIGLITETHGATEAAGTADSLVAALTGSTTTTRRDTWI